MFFGFTYAVSGQPVGAELAEGNSERRVSPTADTVDAQAGNVTALDINALQITNIWQGYYGNISGGITLDDANNKTFYNWSVASPTGEVYATRTAVLDWGTIACSDQSDIYVEEDALNILNESSEGINDTFRMTTHPSFSTGTTSLSTCRSTQAYDTNGDGLFWNVLLNTDTTTMVFASIINASQTGFKGTTVDFELLVPVDTLTATTTYNFYIELT